jgi:hypothetical protein
VSQVSRGVNLSIEADILLGYITVDALLNTSSGEWKCKIRKEKSTSVAAVCLPADPATRISTVNTAALQNWWELWKHHLALRYRRHNCSSPLFLVYGMLQTPQYAICCSESSASETTLHISGLSSIATSGSGVTLSAGCSIRELGSTFGFDMGHFNSIQPWVVYINRLEVYIWGPMKQLKSACLRVYR